MSASVLCPLCDRRFLNERALLSHCGGVLPAPADEPFYCECGAFFCSPQALQLHCASTGHVPETAYDDQDDLECPMCGTIFANEEALRSHCGGVLPEADDEPNWCSCGRGFCSAAALAAHAEATGHEPEIEDDYEVLSALDENNYRRGLSEALKVSFALGERIVGAEDELPEDPITKDRVPVGATVVPLPCGHTFEKRMLWKWFETHRTCPVCRSELEE